MIHRGGCACGGVRFVVYGDLAPVGACHCESCRRWSGYYWAAMEIPRGRFELTAAGALAWWRSSAAAARGFCSRCGSSLLFDETNSPWIEISPGAFDEPTGETTTAHIFCAEAGDYYRLDDGAPRYPGFEPRG